MFGAIWRFIIYRVLGGRVLLGITVLSWLYRKLTGRRAPAPTESSAGTSSGASAPPNS